MSTTHNVMLLQQLKKHYLLKIIVMAVVLLAAYACLNLSLTRQQIGAYHNQLPSLQLTTMINSSILLADSLKALLFNPPPCYSLAQCNSIQPSSKARRDPYNAFHCAQGTCQLATPYSDVLWVYKLHYKYILSINITYLSNNTIHSLIVPAPTAATTNITRSYDSNITITIALDQKYILSKYNIDVSNASTVSYLSPSYQSTSTLYIFIGLLLSLVVFSTLLLYTHHRLTAYHDELFRRLRTIESIFIFSLNQFFEGKSPTHSFVLSTKPISNFYQHICTVLDKEFTGMHPLPRKEEQLQHFQYSTILQDIYSQFKQITKVTYLEKQKQIVGNKQAVTMGINDISDSHQRKIMELYFVCKQMKITYLFFKYAYCALLMPPHSYDAFIKLESQPLPNDFVKLFRFFNRTLKSGDILNALKLTDKIQKNAEEEIQIKIQDAVIQKMIQLFKELDTQSRYIRLLGLETQIHYLNEHIENTRFLFVNQFNKSHKILEI